MRLIKGINLYYKSIFIIELWTLDLIAVPAKTVVKFPSHYWPISTWLARLSRAIGRLRNICDIVEKPNSSSKHGVRVKFFSLIKKNLVFWWGYGPIRKLCWCFSSLVDCESKVNIFQLFRKCLLGTAVSFLTEIWISFC